MNEIETLRDQFSDAAREFWNTVGGYLPKFFAALLLIVVALVVAKLAQSLTEKILTIVGVNKLTKNKQVAKTLKVAEVSIDIVSITARFVFWVVIVIFALTIADVLGLTAMRDVIRELIGYLPNVLAGAIVLTVTIAGARIVRDVVAASLLRMRLDYARSVAAVAYYVLVIFGTLMALDQLGFDTTILSTNITVIVGGFALAFAIAFGLGGKDVASRMIEDIYSHFKTNKK